MPPCIQYYAAGGIMFAGCPFVCASVRTRSGGGIPSPARLLQTFMLKKFFLFRSFTLYAVSTADTSRRHGADCQCSYRTTNIELVCQQVNFTPHTYDVGIVSSSDGQCIAKLALPVGQLSRQTAKIQTQPDASEPN